MSHPDEEGGLSNPLEAQEYSARKIMGNGGFRTDPGSEKVS